MTGPGMQAIVVHALGGPEVLTLRSSPIPQPGIGEVLVRVHAVGVNFSDTERRRGVYDPPAIPWIPGNEAAGIVESVGPGVDTRLDGRRVAFWAPRTSGTYAQYTVAPAAALFTLRDNLDYPHAAALPVNGLTAYGLSHVATSLATGQSALVHAAAGGVGVLLVQLLQNRGVRVFGTASTPGKRDLVATLGATALPYDGALPRRIREATDGRGVDAVFDSVGQATRGESLAVLAAHGHLVYFGEASGAPAPIHVDELYPRSLRVGAFWLGTDPPERWDTARRHLQDWVVDGTIRITLGRSFPLEEASEAHRQLEGRHTQGKLILVPPA